MDRHKTVERAVRTASRRLAAGRARTALRRGTWPIVGVASLAAASRPWAWPLDDSAPLWAGTPRAALIAAGVGTLLAGLVYLVARKAPSALTVHRTIDRSLGLRDVVASGLALGVHQEGTELERLARLRAEEAATTFDASRLPVPTLRPRASRAVLGALALLVASLFGGYDPALARVLESPPTVAEHDAAEALEEAVAALATEPQEETDAETDVPTLQERARSIARDLSRSDRESALAQLQALREASQARLSAARTLRQQARNLARHLDTRSRTGSRAPGDPTQTSSESGQDASSPSTPSGAGNRSSTRATSPLEQSMRLLARQLRSPQAAGAQDAQESRRTLERLSRAADEARRASDPSAAALAESLNRAAEAMATENWEAAAEALDRAVQQAARMRRAQERMDRTAEALARLLEQAGSLERAVQLAMMGRDALPGEMEGGMPGGAPGAEPSGGARGLAAELRARLAALGLSEGPAAPGGRSGPGGRGPSAPGPRTRSGLEPQGDVSAPSRVGEGERAVQVLAGLGQNGEAQTGYSDVYPSYGAIAEDALASDTVPAARRDAVRRYFESIRPGAEIAEAGPDTLDEPTAP